MLRITVPIDVQAELHRAMSKAGDRECGGVLMGEHVGVNHFVVRAVTVQKPGRVAHPPAVQRAAGEWHTHPLFSVQPSMRDHTTMRELATNAAVGANFVVLLIFRINRGELEGSAHTYLPDGSVHRSKLDMENQA